MSKFRYYLEISQELKEKVLTNKVNTSKNVFIMVGPPGIGKSTLIKAITPLSHKLFDKSIVISRDDIVNEVASSNGLKYDDMFRMPTSADDNDKRWGKIIPSSLPWQKFGAYETIAKLNDEVNNKLEQKTNSAINSLQSKDNFSVFVDMTNMNSGARKFFIDKFKGDGIEIIALVFNSNWDADKRQKLRKILDHRTVMNNNDKTIDNNVLDRMLSSYEKPSKSEGFNKIFNIDNIDAIYNNITSNSSVEKR